MALGESVGRKGESASPRYDAGLIAQVAAGDLRAFEELYRLYQTRLTRFIINMIHRPHLAEEVLNDTMLVVWNRAASFDGGSKPSTWIFGIAYRRALSALRRNRDPVEDPHGSSRVSEEEGPDRQLDRVQVRRILRDALSELSADHRAVVDLTYFHEMGYREIAEIMKCPVDTVKTRMFHARRHLKRVLDGQFADWI